jgi:hypothetical protein
LGKPVRLIPLIIIILACNAGAWQQRVDYRMDVVLDDNVHHLLGRQLIDYHNDSPDTLHELYFHLYPNAFKDNNTTYAREAYQAGCSRFHFAPKKDRGWIEILDLKGEGIGDYSIDGTIMKIDLDRPLPPADSRRIEVEFDLKIPRIFSRLGHSGRHYELTQWYPKACVYDTGGWHKDPYHYLGEFYSDFGYYDVTITLPSKYIVAATGELEDSATFVVEDSENRLKRYHFIADNVHDFAWAADRRYKIETHYSGGIVIEIYMLPSHKRAWKEVGEWAVRALDLYSEWYCEYPYRTLRIVDVGNSAGGGMEYPQIVFIHGNGLPFTNCHEAEVIHEIAHQWFYGMIANNELDEAWLDEGFVSFTEIRYFETVYGRENNILRFPSWFPFKLRIGRRLEAKYYYYVLASTGSDVPLSEPSYQYYRHPFGYMSYYTKGALVLFALRDLMGPAAFDAALKQYCYEYRFQHVTTSDFEAVCNQFHGGDLGWFFEQWLDTDAVVDYDVKRFKTLRLGGSGSNPGRYRTDVYLTKDGDGTMPVEVTLTDKRGVEHRKFWINQDYSHEVIRFHTAYKPKSVSVDPNDRSMDYYRWNNHFPRRVKFHFIFDKPDMDAYQLFFVPYAWAVPPRHYLLGGILQGRQFYDSGPFIGKHNWSLFVAYNFDKETLNHTFSYNTPLGAVSRYTRIYGGSYRDIEKVCVKGGLNMMFMDYPFSSESHTVDISTAATYFSPAHTSDPRDVSVGSFESVKLKYDYVNSGPQFGGGVTLRTHFGKDIRHDTFDFGKVSGELYQYLRLASRIKVLTRFYIGYARGALPAQEHFFFSGKLFPEKLGFVTWSNAGDLSSQERWHIWGDGNMRGYFSRHLKGKFIYTATFEQDLPIPFTYAFLDGGNIANHPSGTSIDNLRYDFGLGLKLLGVIRVDFPLWISDPAENEDNWDFRVIAGLTRGMQ